VKPVRTIPFVLLSGLLLAGIAGCASSPPARFYTLEARAVATPVATPAVGKADYNVVVGPVSIPDLVDRPQMVLRVDASRVTIAEQARWAEPLKIAIARALAGNLGQLIDGARVATYPLASGSSADYQVFIDVQTFDAVLGGASTIELIWTVKAGNGQAEKAGRSVSREAANGGDHAALVAAHEKALAAISREIAEAVRALAAAPGNKSP
jgi:uncharacterized lipoprotein YmbA